MNRQHNHTCPCCAFQMMRQAARLITGEVFEVQELCLRCKLEITSTPEGSIKRQGRWIAETVKDGGMKPCLMAVALLTLITAAQNIGLWLVGG